MWSFVQNKSNQRWLWLAINHDTGDILAYTFGKRKDAVFKAFKKILEPFGITMFYTDDWGSYQRNLESNNHSIGKRNTQTIERKNLTLRTRSQCGYSKSASLLSRIVQQCAGRLKRTPTSKRKRVIKTNGHLRKKKLK